MGDERRVSLTDLAEGFEPAEVDLWEGEDWGGLFLTVDVTKPVQDRLIAIRKEAASAQAQALAAEADEGDDANEQVERAVDLIAALYGAVLVPAPGFSRKRADKVVRRAYDEGKIGLAALKTGFQQVVDASRPT